MVEKKSKLVNKGDFTVQYQLEVKYYGQLWRILQGRQEETKKR